MVGSFLNSAIMGMAPSQTLSITQRARELCAQGKPVISLSVGEPDLPTPEWVKKAAIDAINHDYTRYTDVDGALDLKKAIVQKFSKENQVVFDTKEISVACGAKQSIFNALAVSLSPGDEVLIPAPYWVSYVAMVEFFGGVPVIVNCPGEQGFKLTPEQLRKAITSRSKWLILNSPNNPTGASYTRAEMDALIQIVAQTPHLWLMSDEIYEHMVYEGSFVSAGSLGQRIRDRLLIVNGVSKAFSMTGWRIGYAAGPVSLIKAMGNLQSQSTSNPCSISQKAAIAALNDVSESYYEESRAIFQRRRQVMMDLLNQIPGINVAFPPAGAFYIYAGCQGLIGRQRSNGAVLRNDQDVCEFLMDEALVTTVPGVAFGLSPYIRLSYALDMDDLLLACERMKKAVEGLVS
jgi:aspartate aminotransferase